MKALDFLRETFYSSTFYPDCNFEEEGEGSSDSGVSFFSLTKDSEPNLGFPFGVSPGDVVLWSFDTWGPYVLTVYLIGLAVLMIGLGFSSTSILERGGSDI